MSPPNEASVARRPRWRRALLISAQVLVGLGIGAAVAEYMFDRRDDGAFPHVNFYLADPELGVRLEPGASMRFQLRENPISTIHVNSRGYRGDEWPAPAEGDILVVGDSQVFGLGVDDDATFSARLAAAAGRTVLNAGVPTYGPREYLATAREVLASRKVAKVVVVLNFVNDPFELERPNSERHAVWDGWAVRSETAPAGVFEFPGRRWLFSRSHAVYALRRWLHERGSASAPEAVDVGGVETAIDPGTPSEGGLHDLVVASRSAHDAVARREAQATTMLAQTRERAAEVEMELDSKLGDLDRMLTAASDFKFDYFDAEVARSRPGDIVTENSSEAGRDVVVTAAMIREAARTRDKLMKDLLAAEQKKAGAPRPAHELLATQDSLADEQKRLREQIAAGVAPIARPASQFRGYLEQFRALCAEHGAELVVVALPIDVQVDAREWAKYGVTDPPDMRESLVLLDDLLADARDLGLRPFDATPALRAAEPDAFLDHDIHMTAKGHAALAQALAAALDAPLLPPIVGPRPGVPVGRSFVPTAAEWKAAPAVAISGDIDTGCTVHGMREWVRVLCPAHDRYDRFRRINIGAGASPATMLLTSDDGAAIVTPMAVGQPFSVRVMSKGKPKRGAAATRERSSSYELVLTTVAGEGGALHHAAAAADVDPRITIGPRNLDFARMSELAEPVHALCECHRALFHEQLCDAGASTDACQPACSSLWGDQRLAAACVAAHARCDERLACAQNDPLFAPACPEGQIHAFANNGCFVVCDPQHPCAAGTCTPWHGGAVCVPD